MVDGVVGRTPKNVRPEPDLLLFSEACRRVDETVVDDAAADAELENRKRAGGEDRDVRRYAGRRRRLGFRARGLRERNLDLHGGDRGERRRVRLRSHRPPSEDSRQSDDGGNENPSYRGSSRERRRRGGSGGLQRHRGLRLRGRGVARIRRSRRDPRPAGVEGSIGKGALSAKLGDAIRPVEAEVFRVGVHVDVDDVLVGNLVEPSEVEGGEVMDVGPGRAGDVHVLPSAPLALRLEALPHLRLRIHAGHAKRNSRADGFPGVTRIVGTGGWKETAQVAVGSGDSPSALIGSAGLANSPHGRKRGLAPFRERGLGHSSAPLGVGLTENSAEDSDVEWCESGPG